MGRKWILPMVALVPFVLVDFDKEVIKGCITTAVFMYVLMTELRHDS